MIAQHGEDAMRAGQAPDDLGHVLDVLEALVDESALVGTVWG